MSRWLTTFLVLFVTAAAFAAAHVAAQEREKFVSGGKAAGHEAVHDSNEFRGGRRQLVGCSPYYIWRSWDTCTSVIQSFCGSRSKLNWTQCMGLKAGVCTSGIPWKVGKVICVKSCLNPSRMRVLNCFT